MEDENILLGDYCKVPIMNRNHGSDENSCPAWNSWVFVRVSVGLVRWSLDCPDGEWVDPWAACVIQEWWVMWTYGCLLLCCGVYFLWGIGVVGRRNIWWIMRELFAMGGCFWTEHLTDVSVLFTNLTVKTWIGTVVTTCDWAKWGSLEY